MYNYISLRYTITKLINFSHDQFNYQFKNQFKNHLIGDAISKTAYNISYF